MSHLNPEQTAFAACRASRAVALAGAGSGKTSTAVEWVRTLLEEGVPASEILLLTFTRRAAEEMKNRIRRVSPNGNQITAGTYHMVCLQLLRSNPETFGRTHQSLVTMDDTESTGLWRDALKSMGYKPKHPLYKPAEISSLFSYCRNTCDDFETYVRANYLEDWGKVMDVSRLYTRFKQRAGAVDYDDLLELVADRLKDPEFSAYLRGRWRWVLVDEAQDNNKLQFRILNRLKPDHLFLVGDLNQAIYGFRGSSNVLMKEFISKENPEIHTLSRNYRSAQSVLNVANEVIAGSQFALQLTAATKKEGNITSRAFGSIQEEAGFICSEIRARIRAGHKPREIAVLSRSALSLLSLETALNLSQVPYRKYGGVSMADAQEVRDFLSFLRLLVNPADRLAKIRVLTQFPKIGETTAKKFAEGEGDLLDSGDRWPAIAKEVPVVLDLARKKGTPAEQCDIVLNFLKPLLKQNYEDNWQNRFNRLQTIVDTLREGGISLDEFVSSFTLNRDDGQKHPDDHITLSTIHSAKGLEWDCVFFLGVSENQIPHSRAVTDEQREEERRLAYVAVTRPRNELHLTFTVTNRAGDYQNSSPFLPDTLEWVSVGND